MKNSYNNILVVLLCSLTTITLSCNKILDQAPQTSLTAEYALGTAENAEAALSSAYAALLPGQYYGEVMNTITELPGDNTYTLNGARTMWDNFTWNPTTDFVQNYSQIYNAVAKTNLIIALVPSVNMDAGRRNEIIGEAHFLRALHYFNLVRLYGGVPLYTEPVLSGDAATINEKGLRARSTVAEVYAQIESDLEIAAAAVPEAQANAANNRIRAIKGGVYALQAKVFLTQAKWAEAKTAGTNVLNSGAGYTLIPDFDALWPAESNPESIFEINYDPPALGGGIMPDLMLPYPLATYSFDKYPRPTTDFIDNVADKANDKRFKLLGPIQVGGQHVADNYASFCVGLGAGVVDQGYFVYKFRNTGSMPFNNPDNYPILRLADVYLMLAEAENELNGPAQAFGYLNQVRNRAGLASVTISDFPEKSAFRKEVDLQRRLELAFEGERWFDLLRYARDKANGIDHPITALDIIKQKKGTEDATYLLLPLPQSEINSNPKVSQNPGY